jgi:hypothetical protein
MSEKIEEVREQMFDLVGHISYGDFSDLDAYWASLANALRSLDFKDGAEITNTKSVARILSEIAGMSPNDLGDLIGLAKDMEELSHGRSFDAIDEEDVEELESLAGDFEVAFETFLDTVLPEILADGN